MLKRILCLFDKHTPRRSTMHWDGVNYVGQCRHCRGLIRRLSHGNWKKDTRTDIPAPLPVNPAERHSSS